MSLYLGNNLISGNKPINLGVRNIGEIVSSSLPLTDAGLHLLDGSLILGGGIYQGFVDYIADLYTANPDANYFTTEALWQQSVTTYGVCGKFVYDSTNNTVRLPKITGIIEGTTDLSALGDLVEAGLPNITGNTTFRSTSRAANGAFYVSSAVDPYYAGTGGNAESLFGYAFDASRSSSIYGNSSTVQPQTIKAFYYIVIANSTKTDIQVDIDEIVTDLNSKVSTGDLAEVQCVIETYSNGTSWYRVYSDGWCEQGGSGSSGTITLLKPFADTNYTVTTRMLSGSGNVSWTEYGGNTNKTTTTFTVGTKPVSWYACGYIEV